MSTTRSTIACGSSRTSMKIHVEAWTQRFQTHHRDKVTDATFTFVDVGDDGRPPPIPR